ncbi:MAG: preprotein translocase subunit SecG [Marinobacterium sp.]|nr:preprotein translocase subunit SecG [Marinobacterium sp.]
MEAIVLIAHVLLAAGIIALVLLQQGKGAEAGASFGGGASQTVFGSSGNTSFLARITAVLAAGLFVTSFVLAVFAKDKADAVVNAGVPAAEVIEAQAGSGDAQLPVLEGSPVVPADADVPTAD